MTDNERVVAIRAHIAGIERIKKTQARARGEKEVFRAMDRMSRRLEVIAKLQKELSDNGRQDLWEEFKGWAEALSAK